VLFGMNGWVNRITCRLGTYQWPQKCDNTTSQAIAWNPLTTGVRKCVILTIYPLLTRFWTPLLWESRLLTPPSVSPNASVFGVYFGRFTNDSYNNWGRYSCDTIPATT
jgi:hypothetical protein